VFGLLLFSQQVLATGYGLTAIGDEIPVYSGPDINYRPIFSLLKGKSLSSDSQMIQTPTGDFYKVLVEFKGGRKQIGFISAKEKVKIDRSDEAEDIQGYKSLALAQSAMQAGFYTLKGTSFYWTLGYLKYPAPSFYIKGFVGQFLSKLASSVILGGELGTDHLITDKMSVYTAFGLGGMFAPKENILFDGSKNSNGFFHGGSGLRFNTELAAVSVGLLETLVLNSNNALLSWGAGITLEVGL
jgi:hypothetical protein